MSESAELHARAKALFLRARAVTGAAREALLDEACAGDDALRREVDSLLAHDLSATILADPRRDVPVAAATPSDPTGLAPSWPGLLWRQKRLLFSGLVLLALLLSVGLWTLGQVTDSLHAVLADSLTTILDADVEALEQWAAREQVLAARWADDAVVAREVERLQAAAAGLDDPAAALLAAPGLPVLREHLGPALAEHGIRAFGIVDRSGLLLASSRPRSGEEIVGTWLAPEAVAMVASVFEDRPLIRMPYLLGTLSRTHVDVGHDRILSVLAPTHAGDRILAALVFLIEPDDDFTRILSIARMGETGDTYAFNADGLMLSHCRAEDEIVELYGLDPDEGSMLQVRLVAPDTDLTRRDASAPDMAALPLAERVGRAVRGGAGVDTAGYPDVRGVEVVGAWRWLPEYGMGVATEVEKREVYGAIASVRTAFRALLLILVVTVLALLGVALALGVMRARMHRLGRYTLVRLLGEGGMGVVYEARHAMLRRPVALKLIRADRLSPDVLARFEREVQLTSSLSHPATIQVYDYGRTEDDVFYYVMEFLSGLSLAELVRREGALPAGRAIHVLRQVCGSLAEAHGRGLVHRDIKPANIMLCRLGGEVDRVKVLDFGLVKRLDPAWDEGVSTAGQILGTPLYIAPEALRDPAGVDARADLYALGAVAFELLTGEVVFPGERGAMLLDRVMNESATAPSRRAAQPIPEALDRLVLDLLRKDPYARPQSARDVLARLDALLATGNPALAWTDEQARAWWQDHADELPPPVAD